MAFPRYQERRFPGKGWCVIDRTTRAKVLPVAVDHFWHSKRVASQAADELNNGRLTLEQPKRYSQRRRLADLPPWREGHA